MHRKVKGLLSLVITVAMVATTITPASAEELSAVQQPAEEQPIVEVIEPEPVPAEEQNIAEAETVQQPVEPDMTAEEPVLTPVGEDSVTPESVAEGELTAADIVSVAEELMMESKLTPAEQAAADIALTSLDETMFDYLYGKLTEDQKKFRVFAGTDINSELKFLDQGVVPDSTTSQNTAIGDLRKSREGDLQFYTLSGWKLWKVDSNGAPESSLIETDLSTLNKIATEANFKQAVYIENNGTGTNPEVLCKQPILEAVWSCIPYPIPVYDAEGNSAGTIDVNAENYSTISFPNMEGVYWKLIYKDTEYRLNTASEIWTNDTNGIRKIGINFDEYEAKLQAYIDASVPEGPQYVTTGQEGKNGWYTSDVMISAKEGYEVRLSETDAWASAVSVTESGTVTLYVKAVDGAELPAEVLSFSIDKTAPVISGVENGQTYYNNELQVVVTDEHLQTVSKNAGDVGVNDNMAYITLNPSEDPYTILAEDEAGNQTICIVLVKQAEIQLQEGTAEFTQPDWQEGQPKPAPIVSSDTNGTDHITYYYKEQGADDSTYTMVEPGRVGAYTAKAVFAATELYQEVVKTADFNILPIQSVLQEGTAEFVQPGWHVGEEMPAPVVASTTNGVDHITYYYKDQGADDNAFTTVPPTQVGKYTAKAVFAATELYKEVVKTSDFEILPEVPVEEVDEIAPVISGIENGQIYYGDQTATVTDENLQTVTVNGESVALSGNRVDITLKPSEEAYKIVAEDTAGNKTEYTVEVWETWVRDGIKTDGKKMLRRARMYKLGSGQWTVDGDSTVYSGGGTFYVKNGGEYDFKKK